MLASLVEKQLTIPQHYPLTLHALVAACNQSSSRDPVTSLTEAEVLEAVESLKGKRLLRAVLPSHGRSVVRYRHVLDESLGLDAPQLAVLSVLELRGSQTAAELRARTERMAAIGSVDHELDLLASRDEPLVLRATRRTGQKEDRWASLLARPLPAEERTGPDVGGGDARGPAVPRAEQLSRDPATAADLVALREEVAGLLDEVRSVEAELEAMRRGLAEVRSGLDDLRTSLGG